MVEFNNNYALCLYLFDLIIVQLWTINNYHWYLKQQMEFPASLKNRVACFTWDPEVPLRLHVMTRGG